MFLFCSRTLGASGFWAPSWLQEPTPGLRAETWGSGADLSEGLGAARGTYPDCLVLGLVSEDAFMCCRGRLGNRSLEGSRQWG